MIDSIGLEDIVREIVADVTGHEPAALTPMTFGHRSRTFLATMPEGADIVVRTNDRPDVFATTEHNLHVLREIGLPVPQVLATDLTTDRYPVAYMVLPAFPGRDLRYELSEMTRPQMTSLAAKLVSYQKQVAALPLGEGFGYVGIGQRGPLPTWWDFLYFDPDQNPPRAHPQRGWHHRTASIIRRYEDYLLSVPATCFLDDITVKNVIVDGGELRGLVDFDCVCYGDPLWWIGLTAAGVVSDVGVSELFFVDELCRLYGLSAEEERIAALYCAMHAAGFVGRAGSSETQEWRDRMSDGIERWLQKAGG